jgi:hypothetical protein
MRMGRYTSMHMAALAMLSASEDRSPPRSEFEREDGARGDDGAHHLPPVVPVYGPAVESTDLTQEPDASRQLRRAEARRVAKEEARRVRGRARGSHDGMVRAMIGVPRDTPRVSARGR